VLFVFGGIIMRSCGCDQETVQASGTCSSIIPSFFRPSECRRPLLKLFGDSCRMAYSAFIAGGYQV
jgi:hypothetical protein